MEYSYSLGGDLLLSTSPIMQPLMFTPPNLTDTSFESPSSYISEDIYGADSFLGTESSFQNVSEEAQNLQQFVLEDIHGTDSFLGTESSFQNILEETQGPQQFVSDLTNPSTTPDLHHSYQQYPQQESVDSQQTLPPAELISGNQQGHARNLAQGQQHAEKRTSQQQRSGFGKLFIPNKKGAQKAPRVSKQAATAPMPQQLQRDEGQHFQSSFYVNLPQQPSTSTAQQPATPTVHAQLDSATIPRYSTPGFSAPPFPQTPPVQRPRPTSQHSGSFSWSASITPTDYTRVQSSFVYKKRGRGRPRKQVGERSTTPETPTKSRKMTAAQMSRQIDLNKRRGE